MCGNWFLNRGYRWSDYMMIFVQRRARGRDWRRNRRAISCSPYRTCCIYVGRFERHSKCLKSNIIRWASNKVSQMPAEKQIGFFIILLTSGNKINDYFSLYKQEFYLRLFSRNFVCYSINYGDTYSSSISWNLLCWTRMLIKITDIERWYWYL